MATRTIANGGGNWSSTSTWVEGAVPTSADDVVATATSGNLTIDAGATRTCRSMDLTNYVGAVTHNAQLNIGTSSVNASNTALVIPSGMTMASANHAITFVSTSATVQTVSIDTGVTHGAQLALTFSGAGGSWKLTNDLDLNANGLSFSAGTLDFNGHAVSIGSLTTSGAGTKSLVCGTSLVSFNGSGSIVSMVSTGMTLSAASSTWQTTTDQTSFSFIGAGLSYGTLKHHKNGNLTITGANTFVALDFAINTSAKTLTLPSSTTTTVTGDCYLNGVSGKLLTLNASTSGTAATISKASGQVNDDFLSVKDSTATGGAAFYAGANSTNVSGNTGWTFTAAPPLTTTQSAIARISNTITKTQTGLARISNTVTKTQTATGRISNTVTKTQSAISRIQATLTKTQSAKARIQATLTKTQSAKARIQATLTSTQTATARVSNTITQTQTATARVAETLTSTQPAIARIQETLSVTQPAVARVATTISVDQPATGRIEVYLTSDQPAVGRIENFISLDQPAQARIANDLTADQLATARIERYLAATQPAVARIAEYRSAVQPATARVSNTFTATQSAKAYIVQSSGGATSRVTLGPLAVLTPVVEELATLSSSASPSTLFGVEVSTQ